jgi:holo-[acyl-carrier protein] synthase
MSILGIGIDLVDVGRMETLLQKGGEAFRKKIFSPSEILYSEKGRCKAERYAARFAAKEAFVKAFGQKGLVLKDISVHKKDSGNPFFVFTPTLTSRLKKHFGSVIMTHLTLTHTKTTAGAVVVIEK